VTSTEPQAVALTILDLAQAGRFTDIRERFAPSLQPMVSADVLKAAWDAEVAQLGPVRTVGTPATEPGEQVTVVTIPVHFDRGTLTLQVSLTTTGELAGLQLTPADGADPPVPWEPPPYTDPDRFDEHDVTLGDGPLAVPGTLTLPKATGPVPALVLIGGSGPVDRDTTIGKSKPFKDLAWGLASQGIAVLRFDKITHAHPEQVKANRDFTVADEYLPNALAAIRLLRTHPAVAPERVFLAGHSLGGTIAPRIAIAATPPVAGLIVLAGGTEQMQWAAVRHVRYLASLDPATAATAQPTIDAMIAQAKLVDSPDLSPDTPDDALPFGVPAPYWLDLRSYDPVATAAALDQPILICQGERDYQATITDDLARWQTGLRAHPNVTVRTYPADNHFFLPGSGPSNPAELAAPQHVDPQLVSEINDWITSNTRAMS
jgi:dienelactone hydrolase